MSEPVGRVRAIWRFPIKSFQGESIDRTSLSESGIFGDRVLALRHTERGKIVSGKHGRLGEDILKFEARYDTEPHPGRPLPVIRARIDGAEIRAGAATGWESFLDRFAEQLP